MRDLGSIDSMERGTVEWNSGMVERWNTGMVERAINDLYRSHQAISTPGTHLKTRDS